MTDNPYSRYQLPVAHMVEAQDWLEALSGEESEDFLNQLLDVDDAASAASGAEIHSFEQIFPLWYVEVAWADITTRGEAWLAGTRWHTVWAWRDVSPREIADRYGYAWDGSDRSLAELVMKTHVIDHLDGKGAWRVLVQRDEGEIVTCWGQTPAEWAARRPADRPSATVDEAFDRLDKELALTTASAARLLDTLNSR